MLLSDRDINLEVENGNIDLRFCDLKDALQPSSVDIRLDNKFCFYRPDAYIDPREDQSLNMLHQEIGWDDVFVMPPHSFALGSSMERVTLSSGIASRFEGKSSVGRLGLAPHVAAGFIDPGFSGWITLELHNVTAQTMYLIPGMKIGQLCFFRLSSPSDNPYGSKSVGSKYQGQYGPTVSRYHLNFR